MSKKPRVGVIQANDVASFIYEEIEQGIDISYLEAQKDLIDQGKSEDEIEKELDLFEGGTILFGDAWIQDANGNFHVDETKEFAATFNEGVICVEWSKHTKECHHTSPCYMMADGSGLCGDLCTEGNSVIAYDLPPIFYEE